MRRPPRDMRERGRSAQDVNIFCAAACGNPRCDYNFARCGKGTRIDDIRKMYMTRHCLGWRAPS